MIKPVKVKALAGYRIWVSFEDGVAGEFDLAEFAKRGNLFAKWEDRVFFEDVKLDPGWRSIFWGDGDELELCSDMVYMELTGKSVDELMPAVDSEQVHA